MNAMDCATRLTSQTAAAVKASGIVAVGRYFRGSFCFLMGLVYMNNAKFTLAVESFLKCSKFESSKVLGITSYLSFYNVGVIFDVLGFREKAAEYYRMCGSYELAIVRLKCQLN